MGTVYRKTVTRPIPPNAEVVTRAGEQLARWKGRDGKPRTAPVRGGRIITTAATFTAKFRDGEGIVREVATGCRDEQAARRILADLERRAELVRAGVMTAAEDAIADHQTTPLADHFAAFDRALAARGAGRSYRCETIRYLTRLAAALRWNRLNDLNRPRAEDWIAGLDRISARTRNAYRNALVLFANWCAETGRLVNNPFARMPKFNEKTDRRRQRRALTEDELRRLLHVAAARPLAEFGREAIRRSGENRSNWTYAPLTLDALDAATERARARLADNPAFIEKLERRGRERVLIYKTLVLTGLRKGELASLTAGQLDLDADVPYLTLNAADEKNRQGNSIPLRSDLAAELRDWLADRLRQERTESLRTGRAVPNDLPASMPLFDVPTALVRILDHDLRTAGIPKRDERGRSVDVHALRHTFGTLLSRAGVSPRTAQAAMRHSSIDLTMNVYTDPKLLDVHGAVESLPTLNLDAEHEPTQATLRATGTNDFRQSYVAPTVAPNLYKSCQNESFPVKLAGTGSQRNRKRADSKNPTKTGGKASFPDVANEALKVGATGLEPAISCFRNRRT